MKNIKLFILGFFALLLVDLQAQNTPPAPQPPTDEQVQADDVKARSGAVKLTAEQVREIARLEAIKVALYDKDTAPAQPAIVDYNNPDSFIQPNAVGLLEAGIYALLAFLGGFIPFIRKWTASAKGARFITSGIAVFVIVAVVATFRQGAFTEGVVQFALDKFLPSFAYSGLVYNAIKFIIGLIPKKKEVDKEVKV